MGYLAWIERCNQHDLDSFVPLWIEAAVVGAVRRDRVEKIANTGLRVARRAGGELELLGEDQAARTAALDELVDHLVAIGELPNRLGERFPVTRRFASAPLAEIDRAAVSWLGMQGFGVHVNGIVGSGSDAKMWVATRARHKLTFPGMLDNIVAGGQPIGMSPLDNVVKECGEEAGISEALGRRAIAVGAVSYCVEHPKGLKPDTMFCFDLPLPPDFIPRVVDGEVESFELMPIEDVAGIVRDSEQFKFNCNLVIIDFLVRHGWIDSCDPDYLEIVNGLRQPFGLQGFGGRTGPGALRRPRG